MFLTEDDIPRNINNIYDSNDKSPRIINLLIDLLTLDLKTKLILIKKNFSHISFP